MNKKKDICILYLLLLLEFLILFNSKYIIKSVVSSSTMFIFKIFPSLFPTMVLGNLLIKNNIQLIIPKFIKKIFNKLFGFNDIMTGIFIISLFTGTPSNAIYINEYLEKDILNINQAEALLCSTHFINPLFVIGGVGIGVFNSSKIGFLILLVLWINNFIKAFLKRNTFNISKNNKLNLNKESFITNLNSSIKTSINSLLMVFGIVITFNILINLLCSIFNLNNFLACFLNGILEMTSGVIKLSSLKMNIFLKISLAYLFLNFGGICIQMQTFSMIENKKIRYIKYLIFRMF